MNTNLNLSNTFYPPRFNHTTNQHQISEHRKIKRSRETTSIIMEEIVSLIFHGCKLVKDLEQTLPNIPNQPHVLINSCDEISRVFGNVREQLSMAVQEYGQPQPTVPEWMMRSTSQAMDMVMHEQQLHAAHYQQQHGSLEAATIDGGGGNVEAMATANVPLSSALQRTRRRKSELDRRTFRIPAPRIGNTEVPPEDGFTWRKYGQKEILGSRFPRGYYRCTHQKLYNCPAKKQVQRVDNDPYIFEVTYRGDHTCTMSSTAPSMPPPPPPPPPPTTLTPPSSSHSLPQWLSIDLKQSSVGDLYSITTHHTAMQTYKNQNDISGGEGPSSPARYVDYPGMTDLVDTMFNSGSSSNNSMELIFSPDEEKKDKTN